MNDEPDSSPREPPPGSATGAVSRTTTFWRKIKGGGIPALLEVAKVLAAVGVIAGAVIWAKTHGELIGESVQDRFDSWIADAVIREIAEDNKDDQEDKSDSKTKLKKTIIKLIIKELNEQTTKMPEEIKTQTKELFKVALKSKIGPMVAGRFTLGSTNLSEKIDVFWRDGHSTKLAVYLENLAAGDCILVRPPSKSNYPIKKAGLYEDVDIAKLLMYQPDLVLPSGVDAATVRTSVKKTELQPHKGILNDVYQFEFLLATVDKTGDNCEPKKKSNEISNEVVVEYFMATAPLVNVPWGNKKESK